MPHDLLAPAFCRRNQAAKPFVLSVRFLAVLLLVIVSARATAADSDKTALLRVPSRGIQPQTAVDSRGVVHLVYFLGDPAGGDAFYTRSDDGVRFREAIRINSQVGSVMAIGSIRGAQFAIGKNGRIHVAWNGSDKAAPRAAGSSSMPMLYARLNDEGTAFEPQRNLARTAVGLDGGGSVAADDSGKVYVIWHAPEPGKKGEVNRRVWLATSSDEGKTFAPERLADSDPIGACGCCGVKAFVDGKGKVYTLYRGAKELTQRGMQLLASNDKGSDFTRNELHPWSIAACPMSSSAIAESSSGKIVTAWETAGQVYFAITEGGKRSDPIGVPGGNRMRKHPRIAFNPRGEMIVVWTQGTGWNRGGSVAWQVYDRDGKPTADRGQAPGVPAWSFAAVYVRPDGKFTILH
jgi:hypothetical protein